MAGNIGKLVAEVGLDTSEMDKGIKGLKGRLKGIGTAFTAMGAVGAVAIGKSIKTFADFELAITKAGVVSDATAEQMTLMSDAAKELGRTTAFSATQAAEALTFLAMAGFSVQEATSALPGVLQLAAAAGLELGQAADITSNVLAGFGMQVEDIGKVNDVMAKAMTSANTDLVQLAQALKFAGPVAAAAGISFEETTAALALMGNAGIQATMAGTGLRGAMTRLLTPTGAVGKTIDTLGVTLHDTQGNLLPLITIVQEFERVGLSAGDAMTLFGQRAGPAMLALISQGSGALVTLTDELRNSGGTAKRIADAQMATFQGSMLKLKSAVEGVQIALGDQFAPTIQKVAALITKMASGVADLNPTMLKIVAVMGGLAVAFALIVGPALLILGFLPTMSVGFGILAGALGLSGAAAGGASIGFGALALSMLPILAGVVALAAAIALGILIWKNWDKIILVLKATFTVVSSALAKIFDSKWAWLLPGGPLIKAIMFVKRNWGAIWDGILAVYNTVSNALKAAFTSKWGWLLPGGVLIKSLLFLKENWDMIWGAIVTGFQKTAEIMSAILGPLKSIFGDVSSEVERLEIASRAVWSGMEGAGEAMEGTTLKTAALIPPMDELASAMDTVATGTQAFKKETSTLVEEIELAIAAEQEWRINLQEARAGWARSEAKIREMNLAIAAQEFRLRHLGTITNASADIMAAYERGQITLEQAIFVLESRLKSQQAEFAATAQEVSAAEAAVESNREAWNRWRFEQSDVNQSLKETRATWEETLQAVANATGQSMAEVQETLIQAGVGINDLEGLLVEFGDSWVAQFVRMREEATKGLGLDKLGKELRDSQRPKGQRDSELGIQGKINQQVEGIRGDLEHQATRLGRLQSKPISQLGTAEQIAERRRSTQEEIKQFEEILRKAREFARIAIPIIGRGHLRGSESFQAIFEKSSRALAAGVSVQTPTGDNEEDAAPFSRSRGRSIQEILKTFPALGTGAIVTGPTNALIGEDGPEAIIPLDRLGQFGGGKQEILVMLDSEIIARAVGDRQVEQIRVKTGIRM